MAEQDGYWQLKIIHAKSTLFSNLNSVIDYTILHQKIVGDFFGSTIELRLSAAVAPRLLTGWPG